MKFTEEDLDTCWPYYKNYFLDILNGEYTVDEARKDLSSLVGSEYDNRVKAEIKDEQSVNSN